MKPVQIPKRTAERSVLIKSLLGHNELEPIIESLHNKADQNLILPEPIMTPRPPIPVQPPVNYASDFFEEVFNRTDRRITFNLNWANGTGYLNGMISGPDSIEIMGKKEQFDDKSLRLQVREGETVKGIDNFGRRFLYHATTIGGIVVFERYTPGKGPMALVNNHDRNFTSLNLVSGSGSMSEDQIQDVFGCPGVLSMSERIDRIVQLACEPQHDDSDDKI